jgi:hypothetical protein
MANDEVLRLRTTVVTDEGLAKIRAFGRELGLLPQKARPGIHALNKDFETFSGTVKKLGGEVLSVVPAFGALGIGAASAGAAIGILLKTMSDASKRVVELKYASKELGMSERDLRAWQSTAEKAGVSAQAMMSGMEAFKKTTDGLKYNIGGARDELYAMGAGPIVQRMQAATTQVEKMKVAFRFKDELMKDDPSGFKARMFFDQIGLGADKARLSFEQYERAQAKLKPLSPEDQERAQKFADSLVELGEAWDQLVIKTGVKIFPWLTDVIKDINELIDGVQKLAGMLPGGGPSAGALVEGAARVAGGPVAGTAAGSAIHWLRQHHAARAKAEAAEEGRATEGTTTGSPSTTTPATPGSSFNDRFPGAGTFGAPFALRQNRGSLMQRGNSLYHPSAFTDGFQGGGGGGGNLSEFSRAVKEGVFAALVDFKGYVESGGAAGTGMMNASFGGSAGAAGGGGGGGGGGAASFGGGGYTNLDTGYRGDSGNLTPGTGGATAGAAPSTAGGGRRGLARAMGMDRGSPPANGQSRPTMSNAEAAAANTEVTGVGGYNFMGSARARAMGMGDVTPGSAAAQMKFATGIPKGQGPQSITANKYAGTDIAGFLKDLHEAGAPLTNFSGVYANRGKRGGGGASQHAYGNALDLETGFGSGPDNSPALYAWAQKNPEKFAELQSKHHMRNLINAGGGRHDWGHFEWTPQEKINADKQQAAIKTGAAVPGGQGARTGKGSWFGNAPGWSDPSEPVGSPKSNRPGIALRDKSTMGKMFEVTTPDGRKFMLPQTDWGPNEKTGRDIDITAAAGAKMGYTSKNFPTDQKFSYRRVDDAIDTAATGGSKAEGSVHVAIESNGTAAKAKASTDGALWQKTTIDNYKQMQPTSAPVGKVAAN